MEDDSYMSGEIIHIWVGKWFIYEWENDSYMNGKWFIYEWKNNQYVIEKELICEWDNNSYMNGTMTYV